MIQLSLGLNRIVCTIISLYEIFAALERYTETGYIPGVLKSRRGESERKGRFIWPESEAY